MALITSAPRTTTTAGRYYDIADVGYLPSVTTLLSIIGKDAVIRWAANQERQACVLAATELYLSAPAGVRMSRAAYEASLLARIGDAAHTKALERAGQVGSAVHAMIEHRLRKQLGLDPGAEPRLPPEGVSAYAAFERWNETAQLTPIAIEQVVWSATHGYAGTMDVLGEVTIDGARVKCVLDWKTGKAIYREAKAQVSAYARALVEMGHAEAPIHGLIVRLPKLAKDPEPEFCLVPWEEQEIHMRAFLAAKTVWEWSQGQ